MLDLLKNLQFTILSYLTLQDLLSFAQTSKYWNDLVFSEKSIKFRMIGEYPELWSTKSENMSYIDFYKRLLGSKSLYRKVFDLEKVCDNVVNISVANNYTLINDIHGKLYKLDVLPWHSIDLNKMTPIACDVKKCYLYNKNLYLLTISNDLYKDSVKIGENVKKFAYDHGMRVYISLDHKLYISNNIYKDFEIIDSNIRDFRILQQNQILILSFTGRLSLFQLDKYYSTPSAPLSLIPSIKVLIGLGISKIVDYDGQKVWLQTDGKEFIEYYEGNIYQSKNPTKTLLGKEILFEWHSPSIRLYLLEN